MTNLIRYISLNIWKIYDSSEINEILIKVELYIILLYLITLHSIAQNSTLRNISAIFNESEMFQIFKENVFN